MLETQGHLLAYTFHISWAEMPSVDIFVCIDKDDYTKTFWGDGESWLSYGQGNDCVVSHPIRRKAVVCITATDDTPEHIARVAHEVMHLCQFILSLQPYEDTMKWWDKAMADTGPINQGAEEMEAYLMQQLMQWTLKGIRELKAAGVTVP
jgi:hypothetical protein